MSSIADKGAVRIASTAGSICKKMVKAFDLHVLLNHTVENIEEAGDIIRVVTSSSDTFFVKRIIVAAPPRAILEKISFKPSLSKKVRGVMSGTPTWMGNAGKVCFQYESRFWLDGGLNGAFFSKTGPLKQGWDNSNPEEKAWFLCGFLFDDNLAFLEDEASLLASPVLPQLERFYGPQVLCMCFFWCICVHMVASVGESLALLALIT